LLIKLGISNLGHYVQLNDNSLSKSCKVDGLSVHVLLLYFSFSWNGFLGEASSRTIFLFSSKLSWPKTK